MELSFFADENIPGELIYWLREQGYKISGIAEENLFGTDDVGIVAKAYGEGKFIITQDADFGKIIYTLGVPFVAIIYLRPGHFDGLFHIPTLELILKNSAEIKNRTIIIGQRKDAKIKIRIRYL